MTVVSSRIHLVLLLPEAGARAILVYIYIYITVMYHIYRRYYITEPPYIANAEHELHSIL